MSVLSKGTVRRCASLSCKLSKTKPGQSRSNGLQFGECAIVQRLGPRLFMIQTDAQEVFVCLARRQTRETSEKCRLLGWRSGAICGLCHGFSGRPRSITVECERVQCGDADSLVGSRNGDCLVGYGQTRAEEDIVK